MKLSYYNKESMVEVGFLKQHVIDSYIPGNTRTNTVVNKSIRNVRKQLEKSKAFTARGIEILESSPKGMN